MELVFADEGLANHSLVNALPQSCDYLSLFDIHVCRQFCMGWGLDLVGCWGRLIMYYSSKKTLTCN